MFARLSRRTMLAGLAAMPVLALVGCEYDRTTAGPISTAGTLDFANRLRIPALAESTVDNDGVRVFRLRAVSGSAEFLPGVSTPTWSYTDGRYDAGYLGPTLRAAHGERVGVIVENRLSETTTLHWHGMHLPARYDGGPHQPIAAGAQWQPEWMISRPHSLVSPAPARRDRVSGHARASRAVLSRRRRNPDLPHRYGIDDIPVILQIAFDSRGQFRMRGRAVTGLLGDTILVNGPTTRTCRSSRVEFGCAS